MHRFYFQAADGNFGDDLNKWLWDEVLPGCWDSSETSFSGVGTILAPWMPDAKRWVICGSGTGYGRPRFDLNGSNVHVAAVRGPLTAQALGLPSDRAVTDGAILLADLPRFAAIKAEDRKGVIFIPHRSAFSAGAWDKVARLAGVELVDPRWDSELVIQKIRHAELVLADSMHAAIIADTLRVPWVAVATSPEINRFKWLDWALSMNVRYDPIDLPPSTFEELWRSRKLAQSEEKPRNDLGEIEGALELFSRSNSATISFQNKHQSKRHQSRVHRRIARIFGRSFGIDHKFIKRAAQVLAQATREKGIISDDAHFQAKLKLFKQRVDEIRRMCPL